MFLLNLGNIQEKVINETTRLVVVADGVMDVDCCMNPPFETKDAIEHIDEAQAFNPW